MKKILLAAILLFLAVGGFFIWQRGISSERLGKVENRGAHATSSLVFNPQDIVVGDSYGKFIVTNVEYHPLITGNIDLDGYFSAKRDEYSFGFAGTTTLRGTIYKNDMCGWEIHNVATSTAEQLPHYSYGLLKGMSLNFDHVPANERPDPSTRDGVAIEVTIDELYIVSKPIDCGGPWAKATSFKKI